MRGTTPNGLTGRPTHLADDEPDPRDPDVPEPEGPEPSEPGDNKTLNAPISELEGKLFEQRKVLIFGGINDKIARDVTGRLLALAGASDKPIDVYVNSPGGHVESGDTIHDMIRFVDSVAPVNMIGTGWVASAGALIFAAGRPDRRFCLPNTRFLLHQPMGGVRGPATDIDIEAREIIKMRERLNRLFARETGHSYEKIAKDTDRNYWMSAEEAIAYGLVSRVITAMSDLT
ncbi:ATP-dependent Clp protease proteolytic subunit [Acidomonas methanolica]|uniref:ATP-dependent Clp protease proteolytic subunit n=1 Tax=Acidomonas methanolica NBRC 104435 TaxID=1231351 RepID=A0A023D7Y6_ACIMT|nr:ATP-dependent Clp protease proteolytic subunit [Acidomonas methanolica]MBU2655719.1 ATP-dependent Clp protease proteolytic subunit [Acidomonas methanolica]MCQ9157155.1 ATP-dependent Clp protease proteolytic subunit [Acidomonas methanolica]TCS19692.1 ATP-dependent Clp protease protease subunit [Acidomonas methanolica]GAJ30272.1 ATP-dependent Clp protease proteolytic subunit [Acidomonas methanolica NBRC 104435]GEL00651.1 ATP-dependent Clp protease proteolytic subunit [Acidomonas methanolica N